MYTILGYGVSRSANWRLGGRVFLRRTGLWTEWQSTNCCVLFYLYMKSMFLSPRPRRWNLVTKLFRVGDATKLCQMKYRASRGLHELFLIALSLTTVVLLPSFVIACLLACVFALRVCWMRWVNSNPVVRFLSVYVANHMFFVSRRYVEREFCCFCWEWCCQNEEKRSLIIFKRNWDCAAVMLHFEDAGSKWRKKVCRVLTAQVASGTCHCMIMCLFSFFFLSASCCL